MNRPKNLKNTSPSSSVEGKLDEMYKVAKQMKSEGKDVHGGKYVKDENGNIIVDERPVLEAWRQYFQTLLNEENHYEVEEMERVEGPVECISKEEVREVLSSLKNSKAPGPSGLTGELMKCAGEAGLEEITSVLNWIFDSGEVPEGWKESITIPIYKGKGDALQCDRYRGVRLLEHGMKVYEKVLEGRLRRKVTIGKCQFGYCQGRSTTDALYVMRQLQEKYSERHKTLYHIFVDLEKAFDRIPRKVIEWALRRQRIEERLVVAVMSLYKDSRSRVRTQVGLSEEFNIGVGVHQGSALSPLLFILVMEEATAACRRGGPWELLYADDLVLTDETEEGVVAMFNRWREGMEGRGLKINMEKTEVMVTGREHRGTIETGRWPCGVCGRGVGVNSIFCTECGKWCHQRCSGLRRVTGVINFRCPSCQARPGGGEEEDEELVVAVDGGTLREVQHFSYLGNVFDCEGGVERAVRGRVAAAWMKWREIASLLLNRGIRLTTRGKVYEACIRSVMLYGAEAWALTDRMAGIIRTCDRKMLRFMTGVRWQDRVPSSEVARRCGLEELDAVLRSRRLRWFGHVVRAGEGSMLREIEELEVAGRRPRGRPKKRWKDVVLQDMQQLNINEDMAMNRDNWRRYVARPTPH